MLENQLAESNMFARNVSRIFTIQKNEMDGSYYWWIVKVNI